jgi:hypothetical protein
MSTTFFPINVNNYILELNKSNYNFDLNTLNRNSGSQIKMIPPFTKVNFALNYQKKYYVSWSDTRLNDEHQKWISRYAQLQMPNQRLNPTAVLVWRFYNSWRLVFVRHFVQSVRSN